MAWIKISDEDGGVYAREPEPDPVEVITIADIEAEIAELRERIRAAETNLIPVPEKADARVAEVVNEKNGFWVATEIVPLQIQMEQKLAFYSEVKNG